MNAQERCDLKRCDLKRCDLKLRDSFLDFFKSKGHTIVPSMGLVPKEDPTLLFTSAGMVQFKKLWSGETPVSYRRAVSIQKCLRASDLEEVGRSAKYNTFFEMLGNFSFGDYFKREAIEWAWEFITKVVKLSKANLYVSVLNSDTDTYNIWRDVIGIEENRIYKLGKKDNFWAPVGSRGACGPCSEIFYDMGKDVGCGRADCKPGCKCDRFPEIWNLVFPQYDSQANGTLKPLKNKGIDTGMGLERLIMVVQGKKSLFETDLFKPIVEEAAKICDIKYPDRIYRIKQSRFIGTVNPVKVSLNIVADHIRALTFALAEGVYPSNVGRGYLLRRILRRAQREGHELGVKKPFLYKLVPTVIDVMREPYPELVARRENVALIIKSEEESFLKTLEQGTVVFEQVLSGLKSRRVPGEAVFKLYDTYGFPPELTEELANRRGLEVDKSGFEKAMQEARGITSRGITSRGITSRTRAKVAEGRDTPWRVPTKGVFKETKFVGYKTLRTRSRIVKWRQTAEFAENTEDAKIAKDKLVHHDLHHGVELILDRTPFYAESGGQVGDRGRIYNSSMEIDILDTRISSGLWVHIGKLKKGKINDKEVQPQMVVCEVDKERRISTARNHTGTHLLHSALRQVLGDWVHQDGSLVEPERFRFDFTHFKSLSEDEIEKIENLVNRWILENIKVEAYTTSFDEAVESGAMAIFGEKYGKKVRVVKIGDVSMELCGGTHVSSTMEIGFLKIVSETGIHAGIRRVEVITGEHTIKWLKSCESDLVSISRRLGVEVNQVKNKVYGLVDSEKKLKDRVNRLERDSVLQLVPEILSNKKVINGISILRANVDAELKLRSYSIDNLRTLADKLRAGKNRVGIFGAVIDGKPVFITFVSDDLKTSIKAGELAKKVGKLAGGGGGGKDTIAQAGGNDPNKIDWVLDQFTNLVFETADKR